LSYRGGRKGDFSAISPRLFEATALGVCQILETDFYVDGLTAWKHYLPLESDFSNIKSVFDVMRDRERCVEIAEECQNLLLFSGDHTYESLVHRILDCVGIKAEKGLVVENSDSSDSLFPLSVNAHEATWIKSYVARSFVSRGLKQVENALKKRNFLELDQEDDQWHVWAVENADVIIQWIHAFSSKKLIVESLVLPWKSALLT